MKMFKQTQLLFIILSATLLSTLNFSALASPKNVSENTRELVTQAINNYIEGTSYNRPDQISKAFYEEADLFLSKKDDPFMVVPSKTYISWFNKGEYGKATGRIGEIISMDIVDNVATAKVEIIVPKRQFRYVDLFLLKKVSGDWKIISKTASGKKSNHHGKRILFIVSNADYYGDSTLKTGNSFAELINAYHAFKGAGYTVDFISPEGGAIPLAYINTSNELQKQYLYTPDFMAAIAHTKKPNQVSAKNYKAVHYIGGGSAMFGVSNNQEIQQLVMSIYEEHQGIISSVCHGTAGIVNLKTKDGKYLVSGKTISGYPDAYENKSADYFKQFPFQITKTIEEREGTFKYSPRNTAHLEVDGRVVTGQNYLSSALVANKIIEMLAEVN